MRRSRQAKQETHARIVAAAGRRLRADGLGGAGIAELMSAAGLTHGGFYAHFANKDALVAEATADGLTDARERLLGAIRKAPVARRLATFIALYLSPEHRDAPEEGCLLPTLSGEVARSAPVVRSSYTQAYNEYRAGLAAALHEGQGTTPNAEEQQEQDDEAIILLAGLAGTMLLARAVDDPALSERILRVNRDFYTGAFAPEATPVA
jgi:TetR/AcrR family transcriptional repressor of nem operon